MGTRRYIGRAPGSITAWPTSLGWWVTRGSEVGGCGHTKVHWPCAGQHNGVAHQPGVVGDSWVAT